MAIKYIQIPGFGIFKYDDTKENGQFYSDGVVQVARTPADDPDVLRKVDIGAAGLIPPLDAGYIVTSVNATLTHERVLTEGSGITLTDNGAGGTLVISLSGAGIVAPAAVSRKVPADSPYTITGTWEILFCDTDTGAITINLKAGATGDQVTIINCGTAGNDVTVAPNTTELIDGVNASKALGDKGRIDLVYETTEGWW